MELPFFLIIICTNFNSYLIVIHLCDLWVEIFFLSFSIIINPMYLNSVYHLDWWFQKPWTSCFTYIQKMGKKNISGVGDERIHEALTQEEIYVLQFSIIKNNRWYVSGSACRQKWVYDLFEVGRSNWIFLEVFGLPTLILFSFRQDSNVSQFFVVCYDFLSYRTVTHPVKPISKVTVLRDQAVFLCDELQEYLPKISL